MSIYIYNSLAREKKPFEPINPKEIKMYVCGPTVYDEPHIGHARSAYIFDVIRRYLKFRGYGVKFVRNVTDVDDKIIDKAKKEFPGEPLNSAFKKVAEKYLASYHQALEEMGIEVKGQDIFEPKASEYIKQIQAFIQALIDKGAAYSSGSDVYFDITKVKEYGKLSGQSLDKMESGTRVAPQENKRNSLDFALWKSAKENEPFWDSPWGKGRPGWHIECSVMSSDILGDEFDIHGGGIDLIFPHHENEIAQSEGAGKKFAKVWIHHGLLTINGQKMSKSLGNFITVKGFLDKHKNADLLKLLFLSTHYSHPVDYTDEKIQEAKQSLERITILRDKLNKASCRKPANKLPEELEEIKNKFIKAMDDDFNTPKGLAAIFDLVNISNKNINDNDFLQQAGILLRNLFGIFGILACEHRREAPFKFFHFFSVITKDEKGSEMLNRDDEIEDLISKREKARKEKNYALSDKIRKELEEKGIILEDSKDGTAWRRKL